MYFATNSDEMKEVHHCKNLLCRNDKSRSDEYLLQMAYIQMVTTYVCLAALIWQQIKPRQIGRSFRENPLFSGNLFQLFFCYVQVLKSGNIIRRSRSEIENSTKLNWK